MEKRENYYSFLVREIPNLIQISTLPTVLSYWFKDTNFRIVPLIILSGVIALYLEQKQREYFNKPQGLVKDIIWIGIASIFISLLIGLIVTSLTKL